MMEPLTQQAVNDLKQQYPHIPQDYLDWLTSVGWGEHDSGYMLYSGPVLATDLFGAQCPTSIAEIILVADDMAGYLLGYQITDLGWQLVGIDSCDGDVELLTQSVSDYLTEV